MFNDLKFLSERKLDLPWGKENILKFTENFQAMIERSTHTPSPDEPLLYQTGNVLHPEYKYDLIFMWWTPLNYLM